MEMGTARTNGAVLGRDLFHLFCEPCDFSLKGIYSSVQSFVFRTYSLFLPPLNFCLAHAHHGPIRHGGLSAPPST